MADSVVKLRVDSNEYEAKIKRAADGLRAFGENCRKAGESVSKADKDTLDYVRAIGQMETVSKTAKGKANEMTSAFTELSVQYRNLTDEEKQSPFGQALASSLDQLRTRINDSKAQLSEVSAELGNTGNKSNEAGGMLQQLAGKFTMNIDVLKLFNIGLQSGKVALDVAKDAFFASEATVDEWGRVVDSSRSLYEGFLSSINNGDISGFLGRIDQIVSAARAAYNELDRLGTMRTIQAPQISAQQAENDRLRLMIQTGRWISAPGKDSRGMQDGQLLTPAQIRTFEKMLNNGVQNVVSLTKNEVQQTGKTINAFYTRQSRELNMSEAEFRKGTSSMAEFDKRMAGYDAYKKWDADAKARFAQQGGRGFVNFDKSNPYAEYRRWGTFRVDGDRYKELVQLIQQRDQQTSSMYNMQGQAYRSINRAEGITTRSIMGGGSTGGGKTTTTGGKTGGVKVELPPVGSIAEQEAKVQALTKAWRNATDAAGREGYAAQLEAAKKALEEMQGKKVEVVAPGSLKDLNNQIRDLQTKREQLAEPVQINVIDDQIAKLKRDIDALNSGDVLYFSLKVQEDELTTRLNDLKAKRDLLQDPMAIRIVNDDIKRVQADLDEANKKKIEAKVEIDTSQIDKALDGLKRIADTPDAQVNVKVVSDTIGQVQGELDKLKDKSIKAGVEVDTTQIDTAITRLKRLADTPDAQVNVKVVSDTIGQVQGELDKLKDKSINAGVEVDTTQIDKAIDGLKWLASTPDAQVNVKVVSDTIGQVQGELDKLKDKSVKAGVEVDTTQITAALSGLKQIADTPDAQVSVKVVSDTIGQVQAQLADIKDKSIEAKVGINTTELEAQLADLYKLRDQIGQPIAIDVVVNDISDVERQIADIQHQRVGKQEIKQPEPITLEQKIRIKMAEDAIAADANALRNLIEVTIKNEIGDINLPPDTLERLFAGMDVPSDFIERIIRDGLSGVDIIGNLIGGQYGEVINIPDKVWEDLTEQINEKLKELGIGPIKLDVETGNVSKEEKKEKRSPMDTMRSAVGGISQIAGGLSQMGVKLPDSINKGIAMMQGLITAIEGVQAVISLFSSGSQAVNTAAVTANTIAVGALTTAMMANTATNFIPFFNTGGIAHAAGGLLAGHHFSGDNVPVMVNDGELILNRAQQGVIADALGGGNVPVIQIEGVIDGENLRLVQRNSNRRRGRGEYVTSKNR